MESKKKIQKKSNSTEKESFITVKLNKKEREETLSFFGQHKKEILASRTTEEKLINRLTQLKYLIEDYLKTDIYNDKYHFGFFLKEYIARLEKKNNEFAKEIDIDPVKLSHIINKHRTPSEEIFVRLECHSNNNFPVLMWFKLSEKEKMFDLVNNTKLRQQESKHVKHKLQISI